MRILFVVILILVFCASVNAATWCQWDGSAGVNCQDDHRGFLQAADGHRISINPSVLAEFGFYPLMVVIQTLGANQKRDQVQWSFDGSQITHTWTVRDMTTVEVDLRDARPMRVEIYYLWKAMLTNGVITIQQARNHLPQEMIDAYQARDRLENP